MRDVWVLVGGLACLALAADQAVVGAAHLAERLRLSRVLLGAVLIGLGTSLPEAFISVLAATRGDGALAFGNLIGSNAANLGLVLGVAAVFAVRVIVVDSGILAREVPLALGASLLLGLLVLAGMPWPVGLLLLLSAGAVAWILLHGQPRVPVDVGDVELDEEVAAFSTAAPTSLVGASLRAGVGLVVVVVAAQVVLVSAESLAATLGVGTGLVGLAVIAVGTSLPELVTAITAVRRGEDELVLGNVLGSNLANSLLIAGMATLAGAAGTSPTQDLRDGALVMACLVVLAAAALGRGLSISRLEGAALVVAYVLGIAWIAG